jgi:hypothetical protein
MPFNLAQAAVLVVTPLVRLASGLLYLSQQTLAAILRRAPSCQQRHFAMRKNNEPFRRRPDCEVTSQTANLRRDIVPAVA